MAVASQNVIIDVEKDMECPICMEQFTKPKMLNCMHTFCEQCLIKLTNVGRSKQTTGEIQCPTCRYTTKADKGVTSLSTNWITEEKVAHSILETSVKDGLICCSECQNDKAVKFCTNCQLKLCEICSTYHKRIFRYRDHGVVSIEEISVAGIQAPVSCLCDKHKEVLKYFCATCSLPLCLDCTLSSAHNSHQFNLLSEVVDEKLNSLREVIGRAKVVSQNFEKTLHNANKVIKEANIAKLSSVKLVEETFDTIYVSLACAKEELLNWLESGTKTSLDSVAKATQECSIFKSTIEYATKLVSCRDREDVISPVLDMTKKIEVYLNDSPIQKQQHQHNVNTRPMFRDIPYDPFDVNAQCGRFTNNPLEVTVIKREIQKDSDFTQIASDIKLLGDVKQCTRITANLSDTQQPQQANSASPQGGKFVHQHPSRRRGGRHSSVSFRTLETTFH